MFNWLKRRLGFCQHFKNCGEQIPDNMVEVIKFTEYKKGRLDYSVYECHKCGKRAFLCLGYHLMGFDVSKKIDEFINHKISIEELIEKFKQRKYRYEMIKNER